LVKAFSSRTAASSPWMAAKPAGTCLASNVGYDRAYAASAEILAVVVGICRNRRKSVIHTSLAWRVTRQLKQ
jgi:hypothetical protein